MYPCSLPWVAYDVLEAYGQVPTMGLQDNMVFDVIPPVSGAVGTTVVNASVYNVSCTALPNVNQTSTPWDDGMMFFEVDGRGTMVQAMAPCKGSPS